jgi:hypothetical protein
LSHTVGLFGFTQRGWDSTYAVVSLITDLLAVALVAAARPASPAEHH